MHTRATATAPKPTAQRIRQLARTEIALQLRADAELPAGVCGIVTGVALVYGVRDTYRTKFLKGCLDRTKRERVAAGKVQLFANHEYRVRQHVGVVKTLETVGDAEVMTAHLFDTAEGRAMKEYVAAVIAAEGRTGLSVGFWDRKGEWVDEADGERTYQFSECELEEISVTPRPAVPGADVSGVRNDDATVPDAAALRKVALEALLRGMTKDEAMAVFTACYEAGNADDNPDSTASGAPAGGSDAARSDSQGRTDPKQAPVHVSMDERLRAVRQTYAR